MINNNVFNMEVEGFAMGPCLLEGDVITVSPHLVPATNGKDLAVVEINGSNHICRLAKYGRHLLLLHDNGPVIPARKDQVTIIGKVVAINENNHSVRSTMVI